MKKLLSLLAIVAFTGTISAQSTSTDAPDAAAPETMKICSKAAGALPACCAAKAKATAEESAASTAPMTEAAAPSCHGAKAEGATSAPAAGHPGMPACCAAKAHASGAACAGGKAHADAVPAHE